MQTPRKRSRRRRGTHYSSKKALHNSRMARLKKATDRFEKDGIAKTLDFDSVMSLPTVEEQQPLKYGRRNKSVPYTAGNCDTTNIQVLRSGKTSFLFVDDCAYHCLGYWAHIPS